MLKNPPFEPPFGGIRGNAQGSSMTRWKTHCQLPKFLLAIIELFSLALTAEALLAKSVKIDVFLKGWVTLSANFR